MPIDIKVAIQQRVERAAEITSLLSENLDDPDRVAAQFAELERLQKELDTLYKAEAYNTRLLKQQGNNVSYQDRVAMKLDGPSALGVPESEVDLASLIVQNFGADVRYVVGRGFLVYNEGHFVDDTDRILVRRTVNRQVQSLLDATSSETARKLIARFGNSGPIAGTVSALATLPAITIEGTQLNRDVFAFNVANGTVNLLTGRLMEHDRNDLITKIASVNFDADATCPKWETFIEEISNQRPELVRLLQRIVGYCLTGICSEQVAFFIYGTGANGKTTFLNILGALLGQYATVAQSRIFMQSYADKHPNALADIAESRLVVCSEIDERSQLNEELLKSVTGEETRKTRYLYKEFFSYRPQHKVIFGTNFLPEVSSSQRAMWRRIIPIPFEHTVPHDKRDHAIESKLKAELPGILNWAIDGCLEWQKLGLAVHTVSCVQSLREEYHEEEDALPDLINLICVSDPLSNVRTADFYHAYVRECRKMDVKPISQSTLGRRLKTQYNFTVKRTNMCRWWVGIRLLETSDAYSSSDANEE